MTRKGKTANLGSFATAEEAALRVARSPEGQQAAAAAAAAERAAAAEQAVVTLGKGKKRCRGSSL